MSTFPKVSVLMPVFRCGRYLGPAIESILNQTFPDFELLVITESDSDLEDLKTIARYDDSRLHHLQHFMGRGVVPSLNAGIKLAHGQYIARMDGDDISLPDRFEKQVSCLDQCPDIGVLGTQAKTIDEKGEETGIFSYSHSHSVIAWAMAFKNPMAHPSIMFRREVLEKESYTTEYLSEDYWLWARLIRKTHFANLPEAHLLYRFYPQSTTSRLSSETQASSFLIRKRYWQNFLALSHQEFSTLDQGLKGKLSSLKEMLLARKTLRRFYKSFLAQIRPEVSDLKIIQADYNQKMSALLRWYVKRRWRQIF